MNKTVSITTLPAATGFGPGDSLVGLSNGEASLFPYSVIGTGGTGSGSTGATGPTGATGGVETTDRLISTTGYEILEAVLDSQGTLNTPLLLPTGFTAVCDYDHMIDPVVFEGDTWWQFDIQFQVNPNGTVETMMNNIFPILTNPGYFSGYTFRFTEADHGIPDFIFDLQLNDVVLPGGAGWTANVAVTPPPSYPSTIKSLGAIKLTSDSKSLIFGADGKLTLPAGGDILDSNGNSVINIIEVTYSELFLKYDESDLRRGTYYLITDFKNCYDQPDYNLDGNAITTGNYKEDVDVSPIIVFATSKGTLSPDAYQPQYPKDKIKYDITFNVTEVTGSPALGRITERIDEWGNRTDYDHRSILFRRYDNYYYQENEIGQGTVELMGGTGATGELIGTETKFTDYTPGNFITVNGASGFLFEIVSVDSDTSMVVTGLSVYSVSPGANFYPAQKRGLTYKRNNISIEYTEHPTFLFGIETIISNHIGDFATFRDWNEEYFLLPNNVFGEDVIGNRIGNGFVNNTFNSDVEHNVIGDSFRNNTIFNENDFADNQIAANFTNNLFICGSFNNNIIGDNFYNTRIFNNSDFADNIIGVGFNNNIIYNSFNDNKIGNGFDDNIINGEFVDNAIGNYFNNNSVYNPLLNNTIANNFNNNVIYLAFYENSININFQDNTIGHYGDIDSSVTGNNGQLTFWRNRIGNNFENNIIRREFQNNQIGTKFNSNILNGYFSGNVISNGFNSNENIGADFSNNIIENSFNNNKKIGDDFRRNQIGVYFNNNDISREFAENQIGNNFQSNILGDIQYFNWNDTSIENLTKRNYDSFNNSLNSYNLGSVILGKELIMHFVKDSGTTISSGNLVIGESYEIINYQNGDNFTNVANVISGEINTNGCIFIATGSTPTIWGSGSVLTELTSYDEYHKVKFTQWTQGYNNQPRGGGFSYERTKVYPTLETTVYFTKTNYSSDVDIIIDGRLAITRGNQGGIYNAAVEGAWNGNGPQGTEWNSIYTQSNSGLYFYNNVIKNNFSYNTIGSNFGYGFGDSQSNNIGNNFYNNVIGEYFYNNNIPDNFYYNQIGNYFQWNNINTTINYVDFTENYGNITNFSWSLRNIGYLNYNGGPSWVGTDQLNSGDTLSDTYTIEWWQKADHESTGPYAGGVFTVMSEGPSDSVIDLYYQDGNLKFRNDSAYVTGEPAPGVWTHVAIVSTGGTLTAYYNGIAQVTSGSGGNPQCLSTGLAIGKRGPMNNFQYFSGNITGIRITSGIPIYTGEFTPPTTILQKTQDSSGNISAIVDSTSVLLIMNSINSDSAFADSSQYNITVTNHGSTFNVNGPNVYPKQNYQTNGNPGATGSTQGEGVRASFAINVLDNSIIDFNLNSSGKLYHTGDQIIIPGSQLSGTTPLEDIIVTVTEVSLPSLFYDKYTKQIFERKGGMKRVSYYDETDILNIDSVYESAGYTEEVYSQTLNFPYAYTSVRFLCNSSAVNDIGYTDQTVNNMTELVDLFNSNIDTDRFGDFFDNNDGTLGLKMSPLYKKQICSTGNLTLYVYNNNG